MATYERRGKKNLWTVRFQVMENGEYVYKRLSGFRTKAEATEAWKQYKPATRAPIASQRLTFTELCEAYLSYQKLRVRESSYISTASRLKLITPFFADKPVEDIRPADILAWQNTLAEYSTKYIANLRQQLSAILIYAERYYDITNVMRKIEPLRIAPKPGELSKKKLKYWEQHEFELFLTGIPEAKQEFALFFRFLYATGCRLGEARALTWDDIDTHALIVSITKSVTDKTSADAFAITDPKNVSSIREISISEKMVKALLAFRRTNPKAGKYVFGGDRPLPQSSIRNEWNRAVDASGMRRITIHDLRHSHVSLLISRGLQITAIAARLGHSNTQQTLNTYAHMLPSDESRIRAAIADL